MPSKQAASDPGPLVNWVRDVRACKDAGETPAALTRRLLLPGNAPPKRSGEMLAVSTGVSTFQRPGHPGVQTAVEMACPIPPGKNGLIEYEERLVQSVAGLLSFELDRAIEIPSEQKLQAAGGTVLWVTLHSHVYDSRLFLDSSSTGLGDFESDLSALERLPAASAACVTNVLTLHYSACLLHSLEPRGAYALLVAGLETMSRRFGSVVGGWEAWEDAESWDELMTSCELSEQQRLAVRDRLMRNRQIRLKQTFIDYPLARLPDEFWSRRWQRGTLIHAAGSATVQDGTTAVSMAQLLGPDRRTLAIKLRRAYDARSSFVHTGSQRPDMGESIGWRNEDEVPPLSFAALRSILKELVRLELRDPAGS